MADADHWCMCSGEQTFWVGLDAQPCTMTNVALHQMQAGLLRAAARAQNGGGGAHQGGGPGELHPGGRNGQLLVPATGMCRSGPCGGYLRLFCAICLLSIRMPAGAVVMAGASMMVIMSGHLQPSKHNIHTDADVAE